MASEYPERTRIHSLMTKTRFLHMEDALDIGKLRLFSGEYRRGQGAGATAYHYLDISVARVLLSDLAWGRDVDHKEYKGSAKGPDGPVSRVLSIKRKDDKVWIEINNGPGEVTGEGAIKPKGNPTASVSVPMTVWEGRVLGHAGLAYLVAWQSATFQGQPSPPAQSNGPDWNSCPEPPPEEEGESEPGPGDIDTAFPQYGDGTAPSGDNSAELEAFAAYQQAEGRVPEDVKALRQWYTGQNGN